MSEGVKVYRPGVIEVALKELETLKGFQREVDELRESLSRGMFLVRMDKREEAKANEELRMLLEREESSCSHNSSSLDSSSRNQV